MEEQQPPMRLYPTMELYPTKEQHPMEEQHPTMELCPTTEQHPSPEQHPSSIPDQPQGKEVLPELGKEQDQARRAEAQRCRRKERPGKKWSTLIFGFLARPAPGLAPALWQEVFQARLRHLRSSLCSQNRLCSLPTASSTSTWCQALEKESLERMNGIKLSCTTTECHHRPRKHQARHGNHFHLQNQS